MASSLVHSSSRWNTRSISSWVLHRSKLSKTERYDRFGPVRTSRFRAATGASQAKIPEYVWCENTATNVLFSCRFRSRHERLGGVHLPSVQFTRFIEQSNERWSEQAMWVLLTHFRVLSIETFNFHDPDYNIGSEAQLNKPNDQTVISLQPNVSTPKSNRNVQSNDIAHPNDGSFASNATYTNRETIICDAQLSPVSSNRNNDSVNYYNVGAIEKEITRIQAVERSQSVRIPSEQSANGFVSHTRAQSLVEMKPQTGTTTKKIPENLKLSDSFVLDNSEPSPALSTSSGPYISISECHSGNPRISNPGTPLNSENPKFYENPRIHTNIGLNLTNDQPYSPKRNNCPPVSGLLSSVLKSTDFFHQNIFFYSSTVAATSYQWPIESHRFRIRFYRRRRFTSIAAWIIRY